MINLPEQLKSKIEKRKEINSFRVLNAFTEGVDFYSNDYLGFAKNKTISDRASKIIERELFVNGSTGSRLISGTHQLHLEAEKIIAHYHNAEKALLYNSGYDANLGLFSSILQKNDIILYDELIHASIRDGIRLSLAKAYKFKHNSLEDLEQKIIKLKDKCNSLYVSIETVYSMDGDIAPLKEISEICTRNNVYLIVDEAHSTGVFGNKGEGLVCELGLEKEVFARVHTFGKAMGCHGAVVLGGTDLRDFLINFSRSFIYTTALSLHAVAIIIASYEELEKGKEFVLLKENILFFNDLVEKKGLSSLFITSSSAIHCCVVPGNKNVKKIAEKIQKDRMLVKPILSPTVSRNKERLRVCLHTVNTNDEIEKLIHSIKMALNYFVGF